MKNSERHSFHIPVMGLAYTIDTPVKVARFGIDSVISISDDDLAEGMRRHYCKTENLPFVPISEKAVNHRAERITDYLNLIEGIILRQMEKIRNADFETQSELDKYFSLLPDSSELKQMYTRMLSEKDPSVKLDIQKQLRSCVKAGAIDVNIMVKCDKTNYDEHGKQLSPEYSDALAALRGFAMSKLNSSVVFSAGMNPKLYSYCETFDDFYPDENGRIKKKIILKVSDFRSAQVQGKMLARKGIWISEFRIESSVNCGGHAFPTDGLLFGPILNEFREKREELTAELFEMLHAALERKGRPRPACPPDLKITAQGGIGTAEEDRFLREHYMLDGTGWGSPFLLAPDVTNVDTQTLIRLATATESDYYMSYASPLNVPLNNFRRTSSNAQRLERIEKDRPGSPCYKKFLSFNTEFGEKPVCIASRTYQSKKILELREKKLPQAEFKIEYEKIVEKECLCEGLSVSALLLTNELKAPHPDAVAICPGPNLAYFSGVFTLENIVDHIYNRKNILNHLPRPNLFIKEIRIYLDYLKREINSCTESGLKSRTKYFLTFKENLTGGIDYYKSLFTKFFSESREKLIRELETELQKLESIISPVSGGAATGLHPTA